MKLFLYLSVLKTFVLLNILAIFLKPWYIFRIIYVYNVFTVSLVQFNESLNGNINLFKKKLRNPTKTTPEMPSQNWTNAGIINYFETFLFLNKHHIFFRKSTKRIFNFPPAQGKMTSSSFTRMSMTVFWNPHLRRSSSVCSASVTRSRPKANSHCPSATGADNSLSLVHSIRLIPVQNLNEY